MQEDSMVAPNQDGEEGDDVEMEEGEGEDGEGQFVSLIFIHSLV